MRRRFIAGAAALAMPFAMHAAPGAFSVSGLAGWTEQTFSGKASTRYALVRDGTTQVLQADCKASASGQVWKARMDLAKAPVLRWRWKVASTYRGIREKEKAGDDFPARVYVVLDGGWAPWRTRSLVYAWASDASAGSDFPSPYTAQAHVVVLQSGTPGEWREERRDVRADFKRYFGVDVAAIDAVALMTDCDDAGGATRAWYGDLRFGD